MEMQMTGTSQIYNAQAPAGAKKTFLSAMKTNPFYDVVAASKDEVKFKKM